MATWTLNIFPATVNNSNILLHVWSNGPNSADWAAFTPPVAEPNDATRILLQNANSNFQTSSNFPGQANVSLVDLSGVAGQADILITTTGQNTSPFPSGSAQISSGDWAWNGGNLMAGQHYRFTVELTLTISGKTEKYVGDPEVVVGSGGQ